MNWPERNCSPLLLFISCLLIIPLRQVVCQEYPDMTLNEIRQDADEKYGPSADLLNGEKYYFLYHNAKGDPFFPVTGRQTASVRIKGRLYVDQKIRFDIYNQQMLLDYRDRAGASASIILRDEWVDQVMIGDILFKKYLDENGELRFGQVIFEDSISCIYFWKKSYIPDLHEEDQRYFFTEPERQSCIIREGKTHSFNGNGSFLKGFSTAEREVIKQYMKESRLRVKRASDGEIRLLMQFINQYPDAH